MQKSTVAAQNEILFAQISKVDVEKRLVYGRATDETLDRSGEVFDYATSKPLFQKWSEDSSRASNGASVGNLRAMHGKVAAGKLTQIDFNDEAKAIDVVAKVVDDNEWNKVLEGVYAGFSIGGSYANKWDDPVHKATGGTAAKRYTANPNELSLVDRPCNPNANYFEVRKADGVTEKVEFKHQEATEGETSLEDMRAALVEKMEKADYEALTDETIAAKFNELFPDGVEKVADEEPQYEVTGSDEEVGEFAKYLNDNKMSMKDALDAVKKSAVVVVSLPDQLAKGLSTVRAFASVIQELGYIVQSVQYEEQAEQDGSDIGQRLNDAVNNLGDILIDMTTEEVTEMTAANAPAETSAPVLAMADAAKALVKRTDELSKADPKRLQKMHDRLTAMGAVCPATAAKGDGAGDLAKADDQLAKALKDGDEMRKALDAVTARLEKIESEPKPAKAILRAVSKAADIVDSADDNKKGIEPVKKYDGSVDETASLIKLAHQKGGTPIMSR
jgi:hypothetical protein